MFYIFMHQVMNIWHIDYLLNRVNKSTKHLTQEEIILRVSAKCFGGEKKAEWSE